MINKRKLRRKRALKELNNIKIKLSKKEKNIFFGLSDRDIKLVFRFEDLYDKYI